MKRARKSDCCACGNDNAEVEHAEEGGAYAAVKSVGHPDGNTDADSPKFVCDYKRGTIASDFHRGEKLQLNDVSNL